MVTYCGMRSKGSEMVDDEGTGDRGMTGQLGELVERTEQVTSDPGESAELLIPAESERTPIISIVLPTMNEEEGIGECINCALDGIKEIGLPAEIIISDDSTDRTPEIAQRSGARVVTPDQQGYGYAYKYGFEFARGRIIVMGDADTTYDFGELPRLIGPIVRGEADLVMGSRFDGKIETGAMPKLHRYVGNPALTRFLNTFYDAGVSDAHSGYRAVRRDALERLDLRSNGMEFASEMIMRAASKGVEIEEVPITYYNRKGDTTLDSFRDGWRHVKFMLINAPGYLFSLPGALFVGLGLCIMTLSYFHTQVLGITFGARSTIIGSLFTIVGYQIGLLSVFTSLAADPIKSPNDPISQWVTSNFQFGHGALLGIGLFVTGLVYATYLIGSWVASGYTRLPLVSDEMVTFTAIVLGIQTIFSSFHLHALRVKGNTDDVDPQKPDNV